MSNLTGYDDGQLLKAKETLEQMAKAGQDTQQEVILYMDIVKELDSRKVPCGDVIYNFERNVA